MRVVMAGASGFLGQAWERALRIEGHQVVRLVRREPRAPEESSWDPYAEAAHDQVDQDVIDSADVVANLAGAPLAHWPWTKSYQRTFAASRLETTRVLAEVIARSAARTERPPVFMAQNGVAGYGDRGEEVITESTPTDGRSFLAEVSRGWEAAARPAEAAGSRVVVLRTGVVLDRRGGALRSMLPAFRAGLGVSFGDGRQQFATISLTDWVTAAIHLAVDATCSGAYNLVGPGTTTNAAFTAELARQLHRPAVLKVPGQALRKAGGVAGGELLSSARVEPERLLRDGFLFAHSDLPSRLAAALG